MKNHINTHRNSLTSTIALERCPDTGDMEYRALLPDLRDGHRVIISGAYRTTEDLVILDDLRCNSEYVSEEKAESFLDDVQALEPLEGYDWKWASESEAGN